MNILKKLNYFSQNKISPKLMLSLLMTLLKNQTKKIKVLEIFKKLMFQLLFLKLTQTLNFNLFLFFLKYSPILINKFFNIDKILVEK
jgi:hypothetical protein